MVCSSGPVDADAGHLHFGQHPHQGRLDVVVQLLHVLGHDAVTEAHRHPGDVGRLARAVLGQVPFGLAGLHDVETELPGLLAELRQLVLAGRGIEQVRRHRGVHLQPGQVDAEGKECAHGFLDLVAHERTGQHAVELLDHRRGPEQVRRDQHPETRLLALGGHQDQRHEVAAPGHAGPARRQGQAAGAEL